MKVRLLNDGGYGCMDEVSFPVVVEAEVQGTMAMVDFSELHRAGADEGSFDVGNGYWPFKIGTGCEVIS